ncbi:Peptidoglycan/LPS O-acetylase OafA/YrhL, contains acyltransferase and SGNH-hydrolase domains [Micromonospora rhizosphaerae]|uniref:Peptidoglycan/LPS O-acetylase OafA/YrhL, contains acyltransferase and SGNH-hydrolase domains n=1 Tax=Micromonospora rhizosphaerae TaxID=568872 RepID=A0A1C6T9R3_9ACTN|nr:acyltransferase [Micromonospora rhizosphaerae]SCL38546.1 Peptidoglycan/LPS O-acetylase OafA/YrhL, contains acyltransferase and SGNH-hydrolase domains [Micromonospora rhizosphaerae]
MRNRYLDLLRFLAIVRVVVYHVTGWAALTLIFPAMSVMFALAGSLMAASLDRTGTPAVLRRLRRLLPSLWVLAAVFVPAMLLTGLPLTPKVLLWLVPVSDPPANGWGALALSVIWYLRDYLWFVLASPLALRLFRRAPLPTLLAPYTLLAVIEFGILPGAPTVLREFGLYFGAWLLGFAHHDGLLRRLGNRVLVPAALVLGAAGMSWILTHPGARGYDLNDIHLGNALWSAAFILLVIGRAPAGAAWVDQNPVLGRAVTVLNRRALTVYLWHMPFVVALTPLVDVVGWSHQDPVGLAIRVVLVFGLVGLVTMLVGWVEDMAARRPPELLPGGARKTPAGRAAAAPAGPAPAGAATRAIPAPRRPAKVATAEINAG